MEEVLRLADEVGAPKYPVKDIRILSSPQEFYQTMMGGIMGAKRRIVMAALYLGPEEQAMADALKQRASNVRISLLFDGNRGRRGNPSSEQLTAPLNPWLYEHANSSGFIWRWLPWRWRELAGCSHMKFAVFDDRVVLTGANLSRDYFTNRADRYIIIDDPDLADYYEELPSALKQGGLPKTRKIDASSDTWIIPTVDWPGLKQESAFWERILQLPWSHGWMSTAYLNPTKLIPKHWPILTAAPSANGFYGSSGVTSMIPHLYQNISKQLCSAGHSVWEYGRPGWTFHAKGFWLQSKDLMVTAIGSSNYGYRSQHRDLENQAWIVTSNPDLIAQLNAEREALFSHAIPHEATPSSLLVRLLSPLVNSIL